MGPIQPRAHSCSRKRTEGARTKGREGEKEGEERRRSREEKEEEKERRKTRSACEIHLVLCMMP